jgi:spermidine/putrescine-binding protein
MEDIRASRPCGATRRRRSRLAAVAAVGLALMATGMISACGGGDAGSGNDKTLVVATWKGYGADLPWAVNEFQKRTGAKVVFQYFNSEQQLLQLLQTGGVGKVDVALPNLQFAQPAFERGLLEPIDTSRLRNYAQIYPKLRDQAALRKGSDVYAVPWVWGYNDLYYDAKAVGRPIDSWSALWDPRFHGKVGWVDDATASVLIAAMYLGEDPYNPDLDKVRDALVELKRNVRVMYAAGDGLSKAVLSRSVSLGQGFASSTGSLIAEGQSITSVAPKEGAVGWQDNWAIVKDAPHSDLAYKWLDFMTSAEFLEHWAEDVDAGSPAPANEEAVKGLKKRTVVRTQSYPDRLDDLVMQKPMPQDQLSSWLSLWDEVKAS